MYTRPVRANKTLNLTRMADYTDNNKIGFISFKEKVILISLL